MSTEAIASQKKIEEAKNPCFYVKTDYLYPQQMIFRVGAEHSKRRSVCKIHDCVEICEGNNPEESSVQGIYQCSYVFDTPPSDYHAKLEIASIFVQVGEKILFLKRHPDVTKGNTWAIPAGKVHHHIDELPLAAALRELEEETGLSKDKLQYLKTVYIREPKLDYTYHMFGIQLEQIPSIQLNRESIDYRWLNRDEVNKLNSQNLLILDEMPCIQRIFGNGDFSSFPLESYAS